MTEENESSSISRELIITVVVLAAGVLTVAGMFYLIDWDGGGGSGVGAGYSQFTNENFGLSFPYPSSWRLDNYVFQDFFVAAISENSSKQNPKAQVQIYAGALDYPPLDNLESQVISGAENDENMSLTGEIERVTVDGVSGIDFSYRSYSENQNGMNRVRILKEENMEYFIFYFVRKDFSEELSPKLDYIVDNFSLL